ncbi:MAG: GFA family protein [Rhizobiaceae bacterium]
MASTTHLACNCGKVGLHLRGAPIVTAECHCNSCREAGARLEASRPGVHVLEPNGGTGFVLYRRDRVQIDGAGLLREFRLSDASTTRRIVSACCNTPLFLEFKGGHWLSLYAGLWPAAERPRPEMRTMTRDLADPSVLSSDIPNHRSQSFRFFRKLLGAWIAMGFRSPKIEVAGRIDA